MGKSFVHEWQRVLDQEERGTFALVVRTSGSTPGAVGAKMLVLADGSIRGTVGGGAVEARVIADSLVAMKDGKGPRTLQLRLQELGMTCGGEMEIYLEPIVPPRRVIIYGGGHVGAAIAKVLQMLGCRLLVVDERPEWASRDRFPDVEEIANLPFAQHVAQHPPGPNDHVIIVTRGHDQDQLVLEGVINRRPAYLGMIGSKKKAAAALQQLKSKGVPEELIRQVHSPIGMEIGAVTPEEIAISIAAELIALWRNRSAQPNTIAS